MIIEVILGFLLMEIAYQYGKYENKEEHLDKDINKINGKKT